MGWDDSGTGAGPGSARSWCLAPVARAGVRAEGSSLVGEFTGPASREQDCSSSLTSKKITPNKLSSWKYSRQLSPRVSCLFAQGLSPRLRGCVLGQSPLPQPAWVNLGQCLLSDPTSILFAGPLGPEVGAGVGVGQRGSSFFLLFLPPGTTTPPRLRPSASASLPSFAPSPGMGVGQGQAKLTRVGRGERLFWPFFPLPHPPRHIAGWSLSLKSVELGVWFPFDFWIFKLHSF